MADKQIILTSGTTWVVPDDWNNAANKAECIGAGYGGGGAYALKNNVALTPGANVAYQLGTVSTTQSVTDTWLASPTTVKAAGSFGNSGGQASACIGDIKFSGGNRSSGGGGGCGGGAAGPHGNGLPGLTSNSGGAGDAGFGGAGGIFGGDQNGQSGTEWGTVGAGGGGAGGSSNNNNTGGLYGAGSGFNGGGAPGLIVITYTPLNPTTAISGSTSLTFAGSGNLAKALPAGFLRGTASLKFAGSARLTAPIPPKVRFIGAGPVATRTGAGTVTVAWPAGTIKGQLGVVVVQSQATALASPAAPPAGWERVKLLPWTANSAASYPCSIDLLWIYAPADNPGTVTVGTAGTGQACILTFADVALVAQYKEPLSSYRMSLANGTNTSITQVPPPSAGQMDPGDGQLLLLIAGSNYEPVTVTATGYTKQVAGTRGSVFTQPAAPDGNYGGEALAFSPLTTSRSAYAMAFKLFPVVLPTSIRGKAKLAFAAQGALSVGTPLTGTASLSFAASGSLAVELPGALGGSAGLTFDGQGELSAGVSLVGSASLTLSIQGALGVLGQIVEISGSTGLTFGATALLSASFDVAIQGSTLLRFGATGSLTAYIDYSTGFRNLWLAVYAARQELFNALDAENRELALAAANVATANASAIVDTQASVSSLGGIVTAQGQSITTLNSQLGTIDGKVTANATAVSGLTTRVSTAEGKITSQATSITNLSTTVGGHTASITSQQTSINGVLAKAGVTTDVNGYVTGWSLNNNGSSGSFVIRADRFSIVSPTGGARLEWSNGHQRVYDANGVLRVRMGVW